MKKNIVIFILIIAFTITASGCIEKKAMTNSSSIDDTIVYNLGALPEDLIMLKSTSMREKDLILALFEGLTRMDENGILSPALAESWTVSKDGIGYTFKIKKEAKWSNGNDINAQNFVDFFSKLIKLYHDNPYVKQLYCIYGAEDYALGKKNLNGVAIRAVDSKTLEIRLNSPRREFLDILSEPIFVLRKGDDSLKNWTRDYSSIDYSGPFKIDSFEADTKLTMVKNPNYWNSSSIKIDKLFFTFEENGEKALAEFETSNINIFADPPIGESYKLIQDGKSESFPTNRGYYLIFNVGKGYNSEDINLRRAISSAIDRENIIKKVINQSTSNESYSLDYKEVSRPAESFMPEFYKVTEKSASKDNKVFALKGEPDKSREFLKASNLKDSNRKLKLIFLNSVENKKISEEIQKQVKEADEINIECTGLNKSEFDEKIKKGEFDICLNEYISLYNDPLAFMENLNSNSAFNYSRYRNTEYDSNLLKAKIEGDNLKRNDYVKKCEEILKNDIPVLPLFFYNTLLCKRDYINGIYITDLGNVKFDRAYISN